MKNAISATEIAHTPYNTEHNTPNNTKHRAQVGHVNCVYFSKDLFESNMQENSLHLFNNKLLE